ncbi:MAG TPA: hypothetical protein VGK67_17675 [Myxococcales bacterium]|jgi:hypothetical protein
MGLDDLKAGAGLACIGAIAAYYAFAFVRGRICPGCKRWFAGRLTGKHRTSKTRKAYKRTWLGTEEKESKSTTTWRDFRCARCASTWTMEGASRSCVSPAPAEAIEQARAAGARLARRFGSVLAGLGLAGSLSMVAAAAFAGWDPRPEFAVAAAAAIAGFVAAALPRVAVPAVAGALILAVPVSMWLSDELVSPARLRFGEHERRVRRAAALQAGTLEAAKDYGDWARGERVDVAASLEADVLCAERRALQTQRPADFLYAERVLGYLRDWCASSRCDEGVLEGAGERRKAAEPVLRKARGARLARLDRDAPGAGVFGKIAQAEGLDPWSPAADQVLLIASCETGSEACPGLQQASAAGLLRLERDLGAGLAKILDAGALLTDPKAAPSGVARLKMACRTPPEACAPQGRRGLMLACDVALEFQGAAYRASKSVPLVPGEGEGEEGLGPAFERAGTLLAAQTLADLGFGDLGLDSAQR